MVELDDGKCSIKRVDGEAIVLAKNGIELIAISDDFTDEQVWEIFKHCNECYCRGYIMGRRYKSLEVFQVLNLPDEFKDLTKSPSK